MTGTKSRHWCIWIFHRSIKPVIILKNYIDCIDYQWKERISQTNIHKENFVVQCCLPYGPSLVTIFKLTLNQTNEKRNKRNKQTNKKHWILFKLSDEDWKKHIHFGRIFTRRKNNKTQHLIFLKIGKKHETHGHTKTLNLMRSIIFFTTGTLWKMNTNTHTRK